MAKRILLVQGHPDRSRQHLCHALEDAYADAAIVAGHQVRRTRVAELDFPLLLTQDDWEHGTLPESLQQAQDDIGWCEHMVLIFPLWLGDMPALLKGFLEQVARPGFAFHVTGKNALKEKALTGRSARVVVTMGMPALVYRWYFMAHSVKSLERNILGFVGISPVRETLFGLAGNATHERVAGWVSKMEGMGRSAT
jgi:putative NADPH-quinone reductase